MNFYILTIFPQMILDGLNHSIIKRAVTERKINIIPIDIRDFSDDKHRRVDDYPYGGGAGMVMTPAPIYNAFKYTKSLIGSNKARVIYLTPQGSVFNQEKSKQLSTVENIILLCGHYEGIDERVIEEIVDEEISIGDFILTGGELAAMVLIDSISRFVPGVLGSKESTIEESFTDSLLEYPQYTRPVVFLNKEVPEVLLSGHHKNVELWRKEQSINRTKEKRPDLFNKYIQEDSNDN